MKHNKAVWEADFHLFDGEGGGMGAPGGEASQSGPEQGMNEKPQIVYGRDPRGNGQTSGQVGSDNSAPAEDPSAEFAALVGKGGRFHDVYGQMVSNVIQERFKNQKDLQGQVDQITSDLSPLFMNYGLKTGDFEGLKNAIANDEAFYQAQAERAGLDVDQYKENLKLKAEAERGRQITEAYEQQQRQNEMFARWETEAAQLQQAFPNFDLGLELQHNEEFGKLISAGVPVRNAFLTTHADEIFAGANANASREATQNVVNMIQQRAARPPENGLSMHNPAIQRRSDPSQLSDDDLDEINRRVERGEVIGF